MMTIEERYTRDPAVRTLVDILEAEIEKLNFTPTEIRECAMLAAINYERKRPRKWLDLMSREEEK